MKFNKHISDPAEEEHSSALISRALLFIGVCHLLVDPLWGFFCFLFFFGAAAMVRSPPSHVWTQVHAAYHAFRRRKTRLWPFCETHELNQSNSSWSIAKERISLSRHWPGVPGPDGEAGGWCVCTLWGADARVHQPFVCSLYLTSVLLIPGAPPFISDRLLFLEPCRKVSSSIVRREGWRGGGQ